jgi:polar amino acid transport system ATP-binding protein
MGLSFGTKAPRLALSGGVVVSGLGKSYGASRVLSDVNLTMN